MSTDASAGHRSKSRPESSAISSVFSCFVDSALLIDHLKRCQHEVLHRAWHLHAREVGCGLVFLHRRSCVYPPSDMAVPNESSRRWPMHLSTADTRSCSSPAAIREPKRASNPSSTRPYGMTRDSLTT